MGVWVSAWRVGAEVWVWRVEVGACGVCGWCVWVVCMCGVCGFDAVFHNVYAHNVTHAAHSNWLLATN